jgi:hypothetical protein
VSQQKKLKEQFLKLYKESHGHIASSALTMGIDRKTFYNWKASDPDFKETVETLNDSFVELVEAKVQDKIKEGNELWMWRYLKCHKPETWHDEVKQEHSGSLKLEIVNKTLGHDGVIS